MDQFSIDKLLDLMAAAFQQGYALDLIDVSGKRDTDISDEERFCYDAADAAFSRIDAESLYESAEGLGIQEKYPDFYVYLEELVALRETEIAPGNRAEPAEEAAELEEALSEEISDDGISAIDKALYNLANGSHTGNERDSEKYVKHDQVRAELTEEYNRMMQKKELVYPGVADRGEIPADETSDSPSIPMGNVSDTIPEIKGKSTTDVTGDMHAALAEGADNIVRGKEGTQNAAARILAALKAGNLDKEKETTAEMSASETPTNTYNAEESAENTFSGDGKTQPGRYVRTSNEQVGQYEAAAGIQAGKAGRSGDDKTESIPSDAPGKSASKAIRYNYADILAKGTRDGQTVTANLEGAEKVYTVRDDGTIFAGGYSLPVYGHGDEVLIGWKGLPVAKDGTTVTPSGQKINTESLGIALEVIPANTAPTGKSSPARMDIPSDDKRGGDAINLSNAWQIAANRTKYVLDSYEQVRVEASGRYVDILADGKRDGQTVIANLEGTPKKYTVRSDGTILANGHSMMVYGSDGVDEDKVAVGWKGVPVGTDGIAVTPSGFKVDSENPGASLKVTKSKSPVPQQSAAVSTYAPYITAHGISSGDFTEYGQGNNKRFAPSAGATILPDQTRIQDSIQDETLSQVAFTQGMQSQTVVIGQNIDALKNTTFFTGNRVQYLVGHYDTLISSACSNADAPEKLIRLQTELKEKKLPTDMSGLNRIIGQQKANLNLTKASLSQMGLPPDVGKLKAMGNNIPKDQEAAVSEFIALHTALSESESYARKYSVLEAKVKENQQQAEKLNQQMESRYLSSKRRERLTQARAKLSDAGIAPAEVERLIAEGNLDANQAKAAKEYMEASERAQEQIIREGILKIHPTSRTYKAEQQLYKGAVELVLYKEGLPTGRVALHDAIDSGTLNDEQRETAKEAEHLFNSLTAQSAAREAAAKCGASAKRSFRFGKKLFIFAKNLLNRYMGEDYTVRGTMILVGVGEAASSAVAVAKRGIKFAALAKRTVIGTVKMVKTGAGAVKAGVKAAPTIARNAIKKGKAGLRWLEVTRHRVRLMGYRKAAKRVVRKGKKLAVKATQNAFKSVVKLLTTILGSIAAFLLPALIIILAILGIILGILAFLVNTGEEVFYDAGDEDTTAVVQEMVDVLTLCHASFRDSLANQFGGGVSTSATGTTTSDGLSIPQLKKGDSSAVKGLYDVQDDTWFNREFSVSGYISSYNMAQGTKQRQVQDLIRAGTYTDKNGLLFVDNKYYCAAFTSYWGNVGDVLKVEFDHAVSFGSEENPNVMYIIIVDIKAFKDTHYPEQAEGLYGHSLGGHRDFAEFIADNSISLNIGTYATGAPIKATNVGSILDGTCDLGTIGSGSGSTSSNVNADIYYSQVISQDTYKEILNRDTNIYYTFPDEQDIPDGVTPVAQPASTNTADKTEYGFYNNNQELISMILAMFDFDINDSTSVKQTKVLASDAGDDAENADDFSEDAISSKISDDTWKLITLFDEYGLDFESAGYTEGRGYDDLKYSALVGLFNASHIVCGTPVYTYHEGPDGTINPKYKNGRIVGQDNTDGQSYEVPMMGTFTRSVLNEDGSYYLEYYTDYIRDEDGEIVYQTLYSPCPGHLSYSAEVITLHFDALLDLDTWWEENIYSVDDFEKENPDYSSDDEDDVNYRARETTLKRQFQYIKKPDYYKSESGTCSASSNASSSGFSPGTMTETQAQVAKKCYQYLTGTMALTSEQAYGVLVNIMRESNFDYTAIENADGSGGYGLCQWTGGRRTNLIAWCNAHPGSGAYNTIEGQLSYLNAEFNSYSSVWAGNGVAGFRQCSTAREAGEYFLRYFEQPAQVNIDERSSAMDSDIATVKSYVGA